MTLINHYFMSVVYNYQLKFVNSLIPLSINIYMVYFYEFATSQRFYQYRMPFSVTEKVYKMYIF